MSNLDTDFTTENYIKILSKYKKTHTFSFFNNSSKNDIILRHDIDFSLDDALRIAKIENNLGIQSTYFILLHSQFYNPLSIDSSEFIRKILKLGHQIGLHYDEMFFKSNKIDISDSIKKEIELLEQHFNTKINAVVRHNPSISGKKIPIKLPVGVVDAMSEQFTLNRKYISDSVRNWRENSGHYFCSDENIYDELQILIHPVLWTDKILSREEVLSQIMNKIKLNNENEFNNISDIWENYVKDRNEEKN